MPVKGVGVVGDAVFNNTKTCFSIELCSRLKNLKISFNPQQLKGVRVSGGHLCVAEAPTEAAAETFGIPLIKANLSALSFRLHKKGRARRGRSDNVFIRF